MLSSGNSKVGLAVVVFVFGFVVFEFDGFSLGVALGVALGAAPSSSSFSSSSFSSSSFSSSSFYFIFYDPQKHKLTLISQLKPVLITILKSIFQ